MSLGAPLDEPTLADARLPEDDGHQTASGQAGGQDMRNLRVFGARPTSVVW